MQLGKKEYLILRPHNIYGPRMGYSHVIPEIIKKLCSQKKIKVFSSFHKRAFCFIDDAINQILSLSFKKKHKNKIYNIGNMKEEINIFSLANKIKRIIKSESILVRGPITKGSPIRRVPDMIKTNMKTKINYFTKLDKGLETTIKWYLKDLKNNFMKNLVVSITNSIKQSISKLEKNREKCLLVINSKEKLVGTLTDGDIRRAMLRGANIDSKIGKYIKKKPIILKEREISHNVSTKDKNNKIKILLKKLKDNDGIDLIPIVDKNKKIKKVLYKKDFGKYLEKKKLLFNVPAVIMAGGEGKRLKEFSNYFPKPLLPFENSTAIEYIIGNFSKFNVKNSL